MNGPNLVQVPSSHTYTTHRNIPGEENENEARGRRLPTGSPPFSVVGRAAEISRINLIPFLFATRL